MTSITQPTLVSLDLDQPIWERFFTVAPLVMVGTRERDGTYDLAPKHMAMPLGWGNYFGFITVSFPRPSQVLTVSLTATPRCDHDRKPALNALPTIPAQLVDGVFLQDAYLNLECQLIRIVDDFGENSLIAGRIVAAHVDETALRSCDRDDQDLLRQSPLLAYLSPGRFATLDHSQAFPFHEGFQR